MQTVVMRKTEEEKIEFERNIAAASCNKTSIVIMIISTLLAFRISMFHHLLFTSFKNIFIYGCGGGSPQISEQVAHAAITLVTLSPAQAQGKNSSPVSHLIPMLYKLLQQVRTLQFHIERQLYNQCNLGE